MRPHRSSGNSILAVDPGGTTGWMLWDSGLLDWGEDGREEFYATLGGLIDFELDAIVCERYTISSNTLKKTRQHDALELIGVLRQEAWIREIPLVLQEQNPKFSTNERLKICGLYVKGDHVRSAARQLLLYLVRNNIDPGATPEELRDAIS